MMLFQGVFFTPNGRIRVGFDLKYNILKNKRIDYQLVACC